MPMREPTQADEPQLISSLRVTNFGDDPNLVTEALGLQPTSTSVEGQPAVSPSGRRLDRTSSVTQWNLLTGLRESVSLEGHARALLDKIGVRSVALRTLPAGTSIEFDCTVIPAGHVPPIRLSAETMRRLGEAGISLAIDVIAFEEPTNVPGHDRSDLRTTTEPNADRPSGE